LRTAFQERTTTIFYRGIAGCQTWSVRLQASGSRLQASGSRLQASGPKDSHARVRS